MENKENDIIKLCKLHDEIKNSDIRRKGIEGLVLPPNSKERYSNIITNFAKSVEDYLTKYNDLSEIKETKRWMKERNYDLRLAIDFIDECYAKFDDDDFISSLDFVTLSVLHYIVEYIYFQIFKNTYTNGFYERLK